MGQGVWQREAAPSVRDRFAHPDTVQLCSVDNVVCAHCATVPRWLCGVLSSMCSNIQCSDPPCDHWSCVLVWTLVTLGLLRWCVLVYNSEYGFWAFHILPTWMANIVKDFQNLNKFWDTLLFTLAQQSIACIFISYLLNIFGNDTMVEFRLIFLCLEY